MEKREIIINIRPIWQINAVHNIFEKIARETFKLSATLLVTLPEEIRPIWRV